MFLMFAVHRPDVLRTNDLGARNAAMRAYGLDLWRSLDNEPLSSSP